MSRSKLLENIEKLRVETKDIQKKTYIEIQKWKNSKSKNKDKYYKPRVDKLMGDSFKAYKKYYNLVHENFSDKEINQANKNYNQFMSKHFTNRLKKISSNKKGV